MQIKFCFEATDQKHEIHAEELVQRLHHHFPMLNLDWERGDVYVQSQLDRLIALEAPDVILESHRSYFGNVVYTSIRDKSWSGAIATSYLCRMCLPLGDAVFFDVQKADEATLNLVASEIAAALGMIRCTEICDSEKTEPGLK